MFALEAIIFPIYL